jgi:hypothetical protein
MVAWSTKDPDEGLNARQENNIRGDGVVDLHLRDPANLDFRPKPGSEIIDAGFTIRKRPSEDINVEIPPALGSAPDIGAYESGDPTYWIPGRQLAAASAPVPPDGSTTVKTDADLMFLGAYKATRHILNFTNDAGDHKERVELDGTNIADPGELRPGQRYTWRVDAVLPDGTVAEGEHWTFTVGPQS